jgi:signal peptidase
MGAALPLLLLDRAATLLCAIAVAGAVAVAGASFAGHRLLVERSDSMRPALSSGDLLLTTPVAAGAIRTGDIVTFADAARGGRLVTHRVAAISRRRRTIVFTTRGDANTGTETFAVGTHVGVQRISRRARGLGRAAIALERIPSWALLAAALGVLLGPPLRRRRRS